MAIMQTVIIRVMVVSKNLRIFLNCYLVNIIYISLIDSHIHAYARINMHFILQSYKKTFEYTNILHTFLKKCHILFIRHCIGAKFIQTKSAPFSVEERRIS